MKVLLVEPGVKTQAHAFTMPAFLEPLALEILAAYLPEHEVRILDLRFGDTLDDTLREFAPDIVGVTSLTTEVYDAQLALDRARALLPDVVTVAGGVHASLMSQDFERPSVDAIVKREGDLTFRELVSAVQMGRPLSSVRGLRVRQADGSYADTPERTERVPMDEAPIPRRDLVAHHRHAYHFLYERPCVAIETARGCPFRCDFCSVWKVHPGSCRYRSAEHVFAELESVEEKHTLFVDDNFLADVSRARVLSEMIRASGIQKTYGIQARSDTIVRHPEIMEAWAKIGLKGILIGIETPDPVRLKRLNKSNSIQNNDETIRICQANGVDVWAALIVDPDFDADDFERLMEYVESHRIRLRQFTILTPLPGTPLFERQSERLVTRDYRLYDCLHAVTPTKLPREEFYRRFAGLYRRSYGLRSMWDALFRRSLPLGDLWQLWRGVARLCNPKAYLESERAQQTPFLNDPQAAPAYGIPKEQETVTPLSPAMEE